LIYLQTAFPKGVPEDYDSCFFYNDENPIGELTTSLFGISSQITVYNLRLFGRKCGKEKALKT
jgi:hypothetical protein